MTNMSGRRGSATSVYESELKNAKQHNLKIRKQIRELDGEIQAIAKLLGKDDAEVQKILADVMTLVAPKSEVLKKEGEIFTSVTIFWRGLMIIFNELVVFISAWSMFYKDFFKKYEFYS